MAMRKVRVEEAVGMVLGHELRIVCLASKQISRL